MFTRLKMFLLLRRYRRCQSNTPLPTPAGGTPEWSTLRNSTPKAGLMRRSGGGALPLIKSMCAQEVGRTWYSTKSGSQGEETRYRKNQGRVFPPGSIDTYSFCFVVASSTQPCARILLAHKRIKRNTSRRMTSLSTRVYPNG